MDDTHQNRRQRPSLCSRDISQYTLRRRALPCVDLAGIRRWTTEAEDGAEFHASSARMTWTNRRKTRPRPRASTSVPCVTATPRPTTGLPRRRNETAAYSVNCPPTHVHRRPVIQPYPVPSASQTSSSITGRPERSLI